MTFKILQVIPYTEDGMELAKRLRAVAHELERVVDHFKDNHVGDNDISRKGRHQRWLIFKTMEWAKFFLSK